jgi:hypothetical protein
LGKIKKKQPTGKRGGKKNKKKRERFGRREISLPHKNKDPIFFFSRPPPHPPLLKRESVLAAGRGGVN